MDSTYLLVIDNSPDHAQIVNSFLRNAGVAVRVVNASSILELEEALKEKSPFLILIGTQLPASVKIGQIMQVADQYSTAVVLQFKSEDTTNVEAAVATHPLLVINAEENDQLMQVVKQHMSGGTTAREYDDLLLKLEELRHRYDLLLDSARDSIAYIHEGLHIYANRTQRIPTSKVNEAMQKVIEAYPPPAYKGKYIRIKYVTQLPTHTPAFAFYCNLPQYVREPYKRYLENKSRENFDFTGVPIQIFMRKK